MKSIGIVGFGNMGEAFGAGLAAKFTDLKLAVLEKYPEAARKAAALGARLASDLTDLTHSAEVLILAIKPQDLPTFLEDLKPLVKGKQVISVAAGLKTSFFQEKLGIRDVVRFMPNLAAKNGKALVGVSPGAGCSPEFEALSLEIAGAGGRAARIPEKLMPAITGLSGSGIAYVFHFIHALAMGGVREGFPYAQSLEYALTTVEGAVSLLQSTGDHPIAFESKVTSPAGTTVEGVRALETSDFTAAVMDAVSSASRRAQELEG